MAAPDNPTAPRRLAAPARLLLALAVWLAPAASPAQDVHYTNRPEIRIPFERNTSGRIREVQLFISTDGGRDWRNVSSANPAEGYFPLYRAPADGTYLFAVRTLDVQGRTYPETLSDLQVQQRVVVDQKPPEVRLRQIADSRPGVVTVEWEVRDDNLDLRRFALEWRVAGGDWRRELQATPAPTGTQSWQWSPGARLDVRLRVFDRAGNDGMLQIVAGLTADGQPLTTGPAGGGSGGSGSPGIRYVNTLKISIPYRITRMPPSGFSVFDLWYTTDRGGQRWFKAPKKDDGPPSPTSQPLSPGEGAGGPEKVWLFEADKPGLYGFRFITRNGVGIGDDDPKPGDMPTSWVMVDTEEPQVRLKAQPGKGYDVRNVRIEWSAEDPNLEDRPVTIEYAKVEGNTPPTEADWKPIEGLAGPQNKSDSFTWTVGPSGPFRFHIRALARDKAGNVGKAQTPQPLIVDLEHPGVEIIDVKPAGPGGRPER